MYHLSRSKIVGSDGSDPPLHLALPGGINVICKTRCVINEVHGWIKTALSGDDTPHVSEN